MSKIKLCLRLVNAVRLVIDAHQLVGADRGMSNRLVQGRMRNLEIDFYNYMFEVSMWLATDAPQRVCPVGPARSRHQQQAETREDTMVSSLCVRLVRVNSGPVYHIDS